MNVKAYLTHTVCGNCFDAIRPGREPVRVRNADMEPCCRCGRPTAEGLYVREPRDAFQCDGACEAE